MCAAKTRMPSYLSSGEEGCEVHFESCTEPVGESSGGKFNLVPVLGLLCKRRAATIG